MVMTRIESLKECLENLFWGPVDSSDRDTLERSLILADIVSLELWGGTRGWERATDEQFQTLVSRLKAELREPQKRDAGVEEDIPSHDQAAWRYCVRPNQI